MANSAVDSTTVDTTCDFDKFLEIYTLAIYTPMTLTSSTGLMYDTEASDVLMIVTGIC
jgi:hypothetical protein